MNIFDHIEKTPTVMNDTVAYPFNIDLYIKMKMEKYLSDYKRKYDFDHVEHKMLELSQILEDERNIYIQTSHELINKYKYQFDIYLKSVNQDFHDMSKNAIDNFIYILKIRGWNVRLYQWVDHDTYYVNIKISPLFSAKL